MYFKNGDHAKKYEQLLGSKQDDVDRDFKAACYVLAAIGRDRNFITEHVWPDYNSILFSKIVSYSEPWSSGEKALVMLAATLFNSSAWPITVDDIFYSLDTANTLVALEALRFRYGPRVIERREQPGRLEHPLGNQEREPETATAVGLRRGEALEGSLL